MRELSVAEQTYQAVLAVISDGLSVSQVAEKGGCVASRCGVRPTHGSTLLVARAGVRWPVFSSRREGEGRR
jgi:hypothetical protein